MRPQKRPRKGVILDSDDDDATENTSSQTSVTSRASGKITKVQTATVKGASKSNAAGGSISKRAKAGGTLHTFFNARTQAQGAGSNSSSRGVSPVSRNAGDDDEIEEDAEEPKAVAIRGKRKFTPTPKELHSGDPTRHMSRGPVKRSTLGTSNAAGSHSAQGSTAARAISSHKPWVDMFPPLNVEELAVHKKKVTEVDEWLRIASAGNKSQRLLIVKGPAGSGKTAVVSTLAQARNLEVMHWSNPSSLVYGDEDYQSASSQFEDFLGLSAPFTSLSFGENTATSVLAPRQAGKALTDRITLIEEIHIIARWSNALVRFRETIMLHLSSLQSQPVVVIISEEDNTSSNAVETMTAHSLLGPDILQHPAVAIIEFNPVAPTFVSKAVDLVIKKEARLSGRRRIPGPSLLRALAETGDIRSAIGMLEMMCLNEDDDALSGRVAAKGTKAAKTKLPLTAAETATLNAISERESSLGLFHAVGKVVYNKREEQAADQPPNFLAEHARPTSSVVNVDDLFAQAATDVDTLVAALHENYALSCEAEDPLAHIEGCLASLSDADVIASFDPGKGAHVAGRRYFQGAIAVDGYRHSEMVFNTAVRGLLFSLPSPVKRRSKSGFTNGDPYKMQYPNSIRLRKTVMDMQDRLSQYTFSDATIYIGRGRLHNPQRPAQRGVESWAASIPGFELFASSRNNTQSIEQSESRAVRKLDKKELVTVQLPYVAIISAVRGIRYGPMPPEDLVRFVSLSGDQVRPQGRASGRSSIWNGKAGDDQQENTVADTGDKLVLSDDDIED